MAEADRAKSTWLVAAWPGMGNVAVIAAGYLVHQLEMKPVAEISPEGRFDIAQVEVKKGVIAPPRLPRSVFYRLDRGARERSLLVFLSEAQPTDDGYGFARHLLDHAERLGAERVMTFASMASQLHPTSEPKVYGAVTQPDMLPDFKGPGVEALEDGQIGGLNGVMLGAAAERGIPGICLLGEIPYFAAGVPNPKAAMAVLKAFAAITGIPVDVGDLAESAAAVDSALADLLERMREQGREEGGPTAVESGDEEEPPVLPSAPEPKETTLDAAARRRLETMFEEAKKDRAKAVKLKRELDRLKVFGEYENRFLDLFKRAE